MLELILAKMGISAEQAPAVTTRGCDVLVTAGAGTGKTRTLVVRYLGLLADGLPLRSIVAITFTRKAAREMRNRVRSAVYELSRDTAFTPGQRAMWADHYAGLDAARIDTIHGLCADILRSHPAEARVDPRLAVLDEAPAQLLRAQALEEALALVSEDPLASRLLAAWGEREVRRELDGMLRQRVDVDEALRGLPAEVLPLWQQKLQQHQDAVLNGLLEDCVWNDAVSLLRSCAADQDSDLMEIARCRALAALDALPSAPSRLEALAIVREINLRGGSKKAWPGGEDELAQVKDALRSMRALWKAQDPARWAISAQDQDLARVYPALRSAYALAWEHYARLKSEQHALDFDDLELGALALLRAYPEILQHWQDEIEALLVDEFQDTNEYQRDLVSLLNGGRGRLFAVGDAKQSIYRFRGADVSVFRAQRQHILVQGGLVAELNVSYRAHQALVTGLNDLLCPVLGQREDPEQPWLEPFAAIKPARDDPAPGLQPPFIELHLSWGSRASGALDLAADALARRLVELAEASKAASAKGHNPVAYGDMAILCRASNSFAAYENALERAGVPFVTVAGGGFFDRPEVRDLLNALRALADPSDDLALVGLLRSPALAVSDVDLYRLCKRRDTHYPSRSLWQVLAAEGQTDDSDRLPRAVSLIQTLHAAVGRVSVAALLKAFMDECNYGTLWVRAGQKRAADNALKLWHDAQVSGLVGVGAFLDYVQGLRDVAAREGEARVPAEGAVQIMSVHQAKGLQFAVVAIGDMGYHRNARPRMLVDRELGVLPAAKTREGERCAVYELAAIMDGLQESAESSRLLYVAATRAREVLLLSGRCDERTDQRSWLGGLGEAHEWALVPPMDWNPEGDQFWERQVQAAETPIRCCWYEPGWRGGTVVQSSARPLARAILPPPLLGELPSERASVDDKILEHEREPHRRVWRVVAGARRPYAPAWLVGTLVHEALGTWRFPDATFDAWGDSRARSHGLTDSAQIRDAVRRARWMLERFSQHTLCEEIDRAEHRLHEVPYHLPDGGDYVSGIIDLLFLAGGRWTVVEFKTDEVRSRAQLEELLEKTDYRRQLAQYGRAVQDLLQADARLVLCFLNYGDGIVLHEEAVD